MTIKGLTAEEKERLDGAWAIMNFDICTLFECPPEGCDECPMAKVIEAQQDLGLTILKVMRGE